MFNGTSTSGTSLKLVQIGNGTIVTTGYVSSASNVSTAVTSTSSTQGFLVYSGTAADLISGTLILNNVSGNTWIGTLNIKTTTANCSFGAGDITLAGVLDRVRITTVNGTDTFDAGSINILYE